MNRKGKRGREVGREGTKTAIGNVIQRHKNVKMTQNKNTNWSSSSSRFPFMLASWIFIAISFVVDSMPQRIKNHFFVWERRQKISLKFDNRFSRLQTQWRSINYFCLQHRRQEWILNAKFDFSIESTLLLASLRVESKQKEWKSIPQIVLLIQSTLKTCVI